MPTSSSTPQPSAPPPQPPPPPPPRGPVVNPIYAPAPPPPGPTHPTHISGDEIDDDELLMLERIERDVIDSRRAAEVPSFPSPPRSSASPPPMPPPPPRPMPPPHWQRREDQHAEWQRHQHARWEEEDARGGGWEPRRDTLCEHGSLVENDDGHFASAARGVGRHASSNGRHATAASEQQQQQQQQAHPSQLYGMAATTVNCMGSGSRPTAVNSTGWVRIQRTDVIRTMLISVLMPAKMQRLEVVRAHSEFLSHFSLPQANPTQPVS